MAPFMKPIRMRVGASCGHHRALALGGVRIHRHAARLFALVAAWAGRNQSRRELVRLDDRELRDIGITRIDALREAEKPFWRG